MICNTPRCKNKARKGRKDCSTCTKEKWRKKYPMKAAFQTQRQNARRRGIYHDLTFEQFEALCYQYNFMAGRGRSKLSFSLDRIIEGPLPGYTITNIQVLPKGINSQKEQARRKNKVLLYDWQTKTATVV